MSDNKPIDTGYTPDVLSCLADLSNDEVFTPPEIAKAMIDLLPEELFTNPNTTFLDPACKSGIFLREIAKKLLIGLKDKIPDLSERIDHILHKQLFGIAITELTSLMSRRSLYCSKYPNGKYSVSMFDNIQGNIKYKNCEHTFVDGKCMFCGCSDKTFGSKVRNNLESHAYEFIHTTKPEDLFKMKFDVIIGNPPYQLNDGGGMGTSALPIYDKFVEQAKKLNPRYLIMIIPSRWFSGGRDLEAFRKAMLHDDHLSKIVDFQNASDCFPGVEIKGGVCYFLWDRLHKGLCNVEYHNNGLVDQSTRPLLEEGMDTFIRDSKQISIMKKVRLLKEKPFSSIVSSNDPYGFDVREENSYSRIKPTFTLKATKGFYRFYYNGWQKNGIGYIDPKYVRNGEGLVSTYRVFIPKAWGSGNHLTDKLNGIVVEPGSASTETYLTIGPFKTNDVANNCLTYIKSKFFLFMVSLLKITQNSMQGVYSMVPLQDFSHAWNDTMLFQKYALTSEEIRFINESILPKDVK